MKKLILLSILTFLISQMSFSQQYGWTDISANIPGDPDLSDVFFVSDDEGWITSSSQAEIYHTIDGGQTFEVQTAELTCNAIHMLNENEGYTGGASGFVYRTTDGGDNWNFHGTMVANLTDISFPPASDTGYCCGINGNIALIHSTGVTQMTSNINGDLDAISFPINSEEGWVCGGDVLRHFKNNVWNGDQDYPSGYYNSIFMVDSLNGWSAGDKIIHTSDGYNWFEQEFPASQNAMTDVFFLNENKGWIVGNGGLILYTTDGGIIWNMVEAEITTALLRGVYFTSPTNGYAVGNDKTLLKYAGVTGIRDDIETIVFEIFPNPVKDKLQITCSEFKTENGVIAILNLDGKKLHEQVAIKGIENAEIDLTKLVTGMYLCKITIGNRSTTKKIIKE